MPSSMPPITPSSMPPITPSSMPSIMPSSMPPIARARQSRNRACHHLPQPHELVAALVARHRALLDKVER
eukprot:696209-Prymnesium_polylepis.1